MANADSRSFAPPPGWRYIVMPAEPTTTDSQKPERRRLAENIICLHGQDREPVVNIRWRGKYPRVVTRIENIRLSREIRVGVFCRVNLPSSANHGVIVRVFGRAADGDWKVKTDGHQLTVWHPTQDGVTWKATRMEIGGRYLTRCGMPHGWRDMTL